MAICSGLQKFTMTDANSDGIIKFFGVELILKKCHS